MRRRRAKLAAALSAVFAAVFFAALYAEYRLKPIARTLGLSAAQSVAVKISHDTVYDVIEREKINYDDMVSFEKDAGGRISALKTDVVRLNMIKSEIISQIQTKLDGGEYPDIKIPLGSIIDGEFFSGKGPEISVGILPSNSVSAEIENVFTEAGINQTRHQVMVRVCISMTVILPADSVSTDVNMSVCIAETVIVGDVPGSFTQVITGDGKIPGLISDYGADKS